MATTYKQTILTVEVFFENRPDMSIHTTEAVQSAIYTSAGLLNSETAGLLEKCWDYNNNQTPPPEITNELYRNTWELSQIIEAMITQTQYIINMGNDFSQGGGSYSIGNVNSSYNRPIDRDTIAPGVHKLLQNARVYNLQSFFGKTNSHNQEIYNPYDNECITRAIGDKRYVAINQPNVVKGNVAYVDDSNNVAFGNPQDLNISTYSTTKIKQWNGNDYVTIDKVNDLAFFGENLWGFRSAMSRYEIYNAIAISKQPWMSEFVYSKNSVITFLDEANNMLLFFVSRQDKNQGHIPISSPEWWKQVNLGDISVDINYIVDTVYNAVVAHFEMKFNEYLETLDKNLQQAVDNITNVVVPNEVEKQLNLLVKESTITIFKKGQIASFDTKLDFDNWNQEFQLVEGVDFRETTNREMLIGHGADAEIRGELFIARAHLPNLHFGFSYAYMNSDDNSLYQSFFKTNGETFGQTIAANYIHEKAPAVDGGAHDYAAGINYNLYLNGNQQALPFFPRRREIYFITFLKDVVKNVVFAGNRESSTYSGVAPIIVNNTNKTIAFDNELLSKYDNYENTITTHTTQIETNTTNIGNAQVDIKNTQNTITGIQTNITNLTSEVDINTENIRSLTDLTNTHTTDIETNATNIQNVVNGLRASTLVNYKGEWIQGTTAKIGEIWSYQTKLYLCKVATSTSLPTNSNDFDLISSFEVNLDNYYTKLEVDNMLTTYYTKQQVDAKLNNYVTSLTLLNYYNKTQINDLLTPINDSINEFTNEFVHVNTDIQNLKDRFNWNQITNVSLGNQYVDLTVEFPLDAREITFSGRFRDNSQTYYAVGGIFPIIHETIFIPTYKNASEAVFVSQLQVVTPTQRRLRVFDVRGNPVSGPTLIDSAKVFWR